MALEPAPSTTPLVVIAHDDPGTADSLRHAVEALAGWQVMVADPGAGELTAALAAAPSVALVGCGVLANLPADCPTPLVAIGDDDRPADVRTALAAGARSLLAWPDGAADLPGELARVAATGRPDRSDGPGGLVVATRGVQGGAGTTTVAIHLAAAWARWGPAPVLLLDLAGGIAFRLDLSAGPTWSSLLAPAGSVPGLAGPGGPSTAGGGMGASRLYTDGTPDAGAFLGTPDAGAFLGTPDVGAFLGTPDVGAFLGMLAEPWAGLSVLPLSGLVDGATDPPPDPSTVQGVLEAATASYRVVVMDLPATDGPVVGAALALADAMVAVGRCETAGVRGLQAALEAWTAAGRDPDTAGAVVTGVRPQAPLAPREVRAALEDRLWGLIPAAAAELAAAAEDGVLLLDRHDLPAVQAMVTLANRVVPFAAVPA